MGQTLEQPAHKEFTSGDYQWFSNLPLQPNPDYVTYFNDFLTEKDYIDFDVDTAVEDPIEWVVTATEAGGGEYSIAIAADERNGGLLLTNDAADNDLISMQGVEENWSLTASKPLWFEAKLKVSSAANVDYFVGLGITDTTPLTTSDRVGFQITEDSASIEFLCEKDSAETKEDTEVDAVDATYITLGFYYNGSGKVEYFVNREKKGEITTNIPDDENLALTIHFQNGSAVAHTSTIDYIYCCQKR